MSRRWLSTFESDLPRLVHDLETLVRLESPSDDAPRVTRIAAWVRDSLGERGVPAELRPCPPRGDALLASVAFREGGTLLLGHLDTVWPAGTIAAMPWRLEGGRASGPGAFDMKAGAVAGMAVLTALVRESRPRPVSLLLVPDEEAGSAASRELTLSVARRHRRVLVLEPSQDGAAKVARKGCGTFEIRFQGRAAHAGLEPEKGASALAEMARFVLFLEGIAVLTAMVRETRPHPVSLLLVPDEEVGSPVSRELTLSVARRHRRVLVLEPSQDGAAKVARKGCGVFTVRFTGRAAHAGLEPEKGASALAEMARCVLFLEGIAAPPSGTTLTPSLARSGSATNVVPAAAKLAVDARAWTREEAERVTAAILGYHPCDVGVTVAVEGGFDRPPLEPTAASEALYQTARRLAGDLGFELGAARVGGASDGNFTAAAGIPTLDGLGAAGGGAHARDEHVLVADLPRRAALLAALVSEP